jgi:hypothetical protein
MPVPETNHGKLCCVSGSKNGDLYDQLPTWGNERQMSLASAIDSPYDQGVVYKKNNPLPKPPDPDGAQAPGMPGPKNNYKPPKNWNGEKVRSPRGYGWPDKYGNIWVPTGPFGHRGPHWDVQKPDGSHENVLPEEKLNIE